MQELLDARVPGTAEGAEAARSRRRGLVVAAVAAVPFLAVAAAYRLFLTPDSPPRLQLTARPVDAAPGVPAGQWSVGPDSVAGYRVREKLVKLPAPNDAVGRTSAVTGRFDLSPDPGGLRVARGMQIVVDVSTLKSDDDRRDTHIHSIALESDTFPTATFVSTEDLVLPAATAATGGRADIVVKGDLTLHGVTSPVSIPLQAQRSDIRIEVVGSFTFGWGQFAMEQPQLSYVSVNDDPTFEFHLFFDPGTARPAPTSTALPENG